MKKITLTLLALVLALGCAFGLAACGGVAGTYKLEELSVTVDGKVITAKAGEDLPLDGGSWLYPVQENDCVFTFKSNGTYSLSIKLPNINGGSPITSHEEGTWEEKDGKINVENKDGETDSFTIDGNKITLDMDIYKIVLKK